MIIFTVKCYRIYGVLTLCQRQLFYSIYFCLYEGGLMWIVCPGNTIYFFHPLWFSVPLPPCLFFSLPPFLFLFFHSVNGKAWEALWVAHRFLEYFLSTVTLNWFKFTWHTQCMIFFKELHNLLRNLCIFLFCYLNYMPFQRCLITSVAGLKRTKTFLMKQWWLYFRSHPTDSWQTFLKITSVPTLVSQTIFLNFSALEWSPRLPQRL